MDEYRLLEKKLKKESKKEEKTYIKKSIYNLINRTLICTLIFIICLILVKGNKDLKSFVYKNVYENNINIIKVEEIYQKYIASFFEKNKNNQDILAVSKEKLNYYDLEETENGISLDVDIETIIPSFNEGIVLYVGDKDEYKDVLVIKQIDGCEVWYIGVDTDLKIYDYVEKQEIIGKSKNKKLILNFKQNGEVVDYKNYLF